MLEPLGVPPAEEAVYLEVLRRPGSPENDLAAACGLPLSGLRRALTALEKRQLVRHQGGQEGDGSRRWVVEPPDAAVSALVRARREELERARSALRDFAELYRQASSEQDPDRLLTTVTGGSRVRDRFAAVMDGAAEELLLLNAPLPAGSARRTVPAHVRSRVVYSPALLAESDRGDGPRRLGLPDAQVRVGSAPAISVAIADRRLGITATAVSNDNPGDVATEVRNPAALETLIALFECAWSQATTGPGGSGPGTSDGDAQALAMLAGGAKDTGVARRLGVSDRTAQRRIAQLINRLGAATRFQAGVQAARSGRNHVSVGGENDGRRH